MIEYRIKDLCPNTTLLLSMEDIVETNEEVKKASIQKGIDNTRRETEKFFGSIYGTTDFSEIYKEKKAPEAFTIKSFKKITQACSIFKEKIHSLLPEWTVNRKAMQGAVFGIAALEALTVGAINFNYLPPPTHQIDTEIQSISMEVPEKIPYAVQRLQKLAESDSPANAEEVIELFAQLGYTQEDLSQGKVLDLPWKRIPRFNTNKNRDHLTPEEREQRNFSFVATALPQIIKNWNTQDPSKREPIALTLAQAVEESAWGASKISQQCNNVFGITNAGQRGGIDIGKGRFADCFNSLEEALAAKTRAINYIPKDQYDHKSFVAFQEERRRILEQRQQVTLQSIDIPAFIEPYAAAYSESPVYAKTLLRHITYTFPNWFPGIENHYDNFQLISPSMWSQPKATTLLASLPE